MHDSRLDPRRISRPGAALAAALLAGAFLVACGNDGARSAGAGGSAGSAGYTGGSPGTGGSGGAVQDAGSDAAPDAQADASSDAPSGWQLIWSDEFNGSGLADPSKWGYEVGFIRNNEAQYYTDARVENAHEENGNLVIEARKESYQGASYTSASLNTKGKQTFLYGRIDVRAKIPTGKGSWPAIWLLGANIDQVGWPACGEIDIMENVGFTPDTIYCTVHADGGSGDQSTGDHTDVTPAPYSAFHVYSMQWSASELDLYVDSKLVLAYPNDGNNPWPFDKPAYLLLNLAIGGSWGGQQGIDDSIFPLDYYIDYVRYYQKAP